MREPSRLFRVDPFLCAKLITVALASLLPVRGSGAVVAQAVTDAGIALLFFPQGAKLSASAIRQGWRGALCSAIHAIEAGR